MTASPAVRQLVIFADRAIRSVRGHPPNLAELVAATHLSTHRLKAIVAEIGIVLANRANVRQRELHTMPYRDYLETPEWRAQRDEALTRAGHRCQLCNRGRGELNVHHRTYANRGYERADDLIVLCRPCHAGFHGKPIRQRSI